MGGEGPEDRDEARRIIDAAWQVLERSGYENLKVQVVLRIAGVSIGNFYRHFRGKDELMAVLLREELTRATGVLRELTAQGTPEERVRAWVDAIVSLRYGRFAGPRARWFTTLPEEIYEVVRRDPSADVDTSSPLREAIAEGARTGVFPNADPEVDARLIQALCSRLDEARQPLFPSRHQAVGVVSEFVLAALMDPGRGTRFAEHAAVESRR